MPGHVGTNDRGNLLHYSCRLAREDEGAEEEEEKAQAGGGWRRQTFARHLH